MKPSVSLRTVFHRLIPGISLHELSSSKKKKKALWLYAIKKDSILQSF